MEAKSAFVFTYRHLDTTLLRVPTSLRFLSTRIHAVVAQDAAAESVLDSSIQFPKIIVCSWHFDQRQEKPTL